MRAGPTGTLFQVQTATEWPETKGIFECLLQTNSEWCNKINPGDETVLAWRIRWSGV